MTLNLIQEVELKNDAAPCASVIPSKEAELYFDKDTSKEQAEVIANNLIGIVDSVLNTYINSFR